MAEFVAVAKLSHVEAGSCKAVQAGDKAVALFNVSGTIYALDNVCLHRGGLIRCRRNGDHALRLSDPGGAQ